MLRCTVCSSRINRLRTRRPEHPVKVWLERIWYRNEPPPLVLRCLAWLYGLIADAVAHRRRARAQSLPVPVIVVGNIAVGGTGKTPCVLWLVACLRELGYTPGVISRGYGGRGPFPHRVRVDDAASVCGDEPLLLVQRSAVPLAVAPDRVAAGRLLLSQQPDIDVLICDDGLQHYHLARDVEICVVDGARGHGNGWRLPAGPLRETPARVEQIALTLVNGAQAAPFGAHAQRFDLRLQAARNLATGERRPLSAFAGQRLHAVAGIGHPRRFFDALREAGLEISEHAFADHHAYRPADFSAFAAATVLMTEKDAVKCRSFAAPDMWAVPAELGFSAAAESLVRECLLKHLSAASV